ncbi:MAG TPA: N-6 DNA methylase [Planktothrix sp.]
MSEELKQAFRSAVESVASQLAGRKDTTGDDSPLRTAILWVLAGCASDLLKRKRGAEFGVVDLIRLVAPEHVFAYTSDFKPKTTTSWALLFTLLQRTVDGANSVAEILSALYEDILRFELQANVLSENPKAKKRAGNFYTGKELADLAVKEALQPLVYDEGALRHPEQILNLRILDPAMGGGSFLLSAIDYLEEKLKEWQLDQRGAQERNLRAEAILHCIHGVDIDRLAVVLCRLVLLLESNCDEQELPSFALQLSLNIKSGDSLFFNWQYEYIDVFARKPSGFDAVIGNPPWEIHKPNSREFFQQYDRDFWRYGKREALQRQQEIFAQHPDAKQQWNEYQNSYKRLKAGVRSGFFNHQGRADLNAYKLFLEVAHSILRNNGMLSFIVPSGIYSDLGARELRKLFVEDNRWRAIFGFENRACLFDIHRSFKFCVIAVQRGGSTESIKCSFMSAHPTDCGTTIDYPSAAVEAFSPHAFSIIELETERDLAILHKLYENSCRLGEGLNWNIEFEREFDMTNDSHLFAPVTHFESRGFKRDRYGYWLRGRWCDERIANHCDTKIEDSDQRQSIAIDDIEEIALPFYEGRMVGQFDFSEKGWVRGKGRQARWDQLTICDKRLQPQYLLPVQHYPQWHDAYDNLKCAFLGVGSATNSRSMIASALDNLPCGNSVPTLSTGSPAQTLQLVACLNSFVFDFALRCRMAGNNLNYFVVSECPLPPVRQIAQFPIIVRIAAMLNLNSPRFSCHWLSLSHDSQRVIWCEESLGRRQLRAALDAIIAAMYGLNRGDLAWILRGCDDDSNRLAKGFWRIDRTLPAHERHSCMTVEEFKKLDDVGLIDYCKQLENRIASHGKLVERQGLLIHSARVSNLQSRARELATSY